MQQAIEECDSLGADTFQRRYGFGQARHYAIWHDGRTYDSKAILGVAQRYATGEAALVTEFDGGKQDAALVLRDLGLDVIPDHGEAELPPSPSDEEQAGGRRPRQRRRPRRLGRRGPGDPARGGGPLPRPRDLPGAGRAGAAAQRHPDQPARPLLGRRRAGRVARVCADRGEPLLSALCVNESGSVGAGYAKAVIAVRGELVGDPDDHAADERLACYRAFGAVMPDDGGNPALAPQVAAVRDRERARRAATRPQFEGQVCPSCNMAIPATGVCDNCG